MTRPCAASRCAASRCATTPTAAAPTSPSPRPCASACRSAAPSSARWCRWRRCSLASVGLIWFSVTNGLLPLNRMRADLNARGGDELAPISDTDVPFELGPVVLAFNGLLDRVSVGAKAQHDFLANVAHQLRTPLAGLRTQLEWL